MEDEDLIDEDLALQLGREHEWQQAGQQAIIDTLDRISAIINDLDESQAAWVIVAMVYGLRLMLMDAGLSQLEANEQIIAGIDSLDGVSPFVKVIQ